MDKDNQNRIAPSIPREICLDYKIIPVANQGDAIIVKGGNLSSKELSELEILTDRKIILDRVDEEWIEKTIVKTFKTDVGKSTKPILSSSLEESIIEEAQIVGASDIHLDPKKEGGLVRFRIDGLLNDQISLEKSKFLPLVNKLKLKADLDITEKRIPQDGRILIEELRLDIRLSCLPCLNGEKLVLRLLDQNKTGLSLDSLNLEPDTISTFRQALNHDHGLIILSGPTGSGKTTTQYAMLEEIKHPGISIVTVEDPVEYQIEGITQVQVNQKTGLGFSTALRSVLRQDPDVIMIGEIRDLESAKIAIQASLTGHLVLATLHTNSALGIIDRLEDMGIPSFLIASSLRLAVAQRLIRQLCDSCKSKDKNGYQPKGCDKCHFSGYRGRIGIYETVPISPEIKKAIRGNSEIDKNQKDLGCKALELWKMGKTSYEEVEQFLKPI